MKSLEDNFTDWEAYVFGLGYGTGEEYTVPALRQFLCAIPEAGIYDYRQLEATCGPAIAWLLINILGNHDLIEYGTSTRHGWLTEQGLALRAFVIERSAEELVELTAVDEDYVHCYPNTCNCGPNGYEEGRVCGNPFWEPVPSA